MCGEPSEINSSDGIVALFQSVVHAFYALTNGGPFSIVMVTDMQ